MEEIKNQLIAKARAKHCEIYPLINKETLNDCFVIEGDMIIFWYNTADNSTQTEIHIIE